MSGLMFPKTATKKKRKKHMRTIMHEKDGTCYLCMMLNDDYRKYKYLEYHHVFGGANRIHSEAAGLGVYLCMDHHNSGAAESVHANKEVRRRLQAEAQMIYERDHTREEFVEIFGRNYL